MQCADCLEEYIEDGEFRRQWWAVRQEKKREEANYILRQTGVEVDPESGLEQLKNILCNNYLMTARVRHSKLIVTLSLLIFVLFFVKLFR